MCHLFISKLLCKRFFRRNESSVLKDGLADRREIATESSEARSTRSRSRWELRFRPRRLLFESSSILLIACRTFTVHVSQQILPIYDPIIKMKFSLTWLIASRRWVMCSRAAWWRRAVSSSSSDADDPSLRFVSWIKDNDIIISYSLS